MALSSTAPIRKKAVWGPKRTLAAAAVALLAFAPQAARAEGRHVRSVSHAKPGVPGSQVKNYKVDDELSSRAARGSSVHISSVIVTLVPGAQLPPAFKRFARPGKLDIINGF